MVGRSVLFFIHIFGEYNLKVYLFHFQLCFDRELGTFSDVCQPLMFIAVEDLHKEEKEIKDVDILKLDIIKGALRTDLLLRLR